MTDFYLALLCPSPPIPMEYVHKKREVGPIPYSKEDHWEEISCEGM